MKWRCVTSVALLLLRTCSVFALLDERDGPVDGPSNVIQEADKHTIQNVKKVAIIGAGSGGASTAYYLAKYAAAAGIPIHVTVFERSSYIGGRSTTVNAWDDASQPVELGASIFVEVNRNLVDAVAAFNLTVVQPSSRRSDDSAERLGIWDGEQFVLTTALGGRRWQSWWTSAKLLWRYGWAPLTTRRLMKQIVGRFLKMYEAPHFPWASLSHVAVEVDLLQVTAQTGEQFLSAEGVGERFAWEVVQASTRVNYAQNLGQIHGLEAMVCMAAEGAMAVEGGNWKIFEGMVKSSGADVRLNSSVAKIVRDKDGTYAVHAEETSCKASGCVYETKQQTFDTVILAAPYQFSNIDFDPAPSHVPDDIPYVKLHVTLFASSHRLSPIPFGLDSSGDVPDVILTTLRPERRAQASPGKWGPSDFFSISTLRSGVNPNQSPPREEYIYKIFSPNPIEDSDLLFLLTSIPPKLYDSTQGLPKEDVSWVYRKEWHSYPYLYPRVTFEEMKLDDGLWYTSGIESFISTMETSSLMGKNVAKLIANGWSQRSGDTSKPRSDIDSNDRAIQQEL